MKEEDMSGMIQNLSSMLNSKDMPENIKNALQNFTKKILQILVMALDKKKRI